MNKSQNLLQPMDLPDTTLHFVTCQVPQPFLEQAALSANIAYGTECVLTTALV